MKYSLFAARLLLACLLPATTLQASAPAEWLAAPNAAHAPAGRPASEART